MGPPSSHKIKVALRGLGYLAWVSELSTQRRPHTNCFSVLTSWRAVRSELDRGGTSDFVSLSIPPLVFHTTQSARVWQAVHRAHVPLPASRHGPVILKAPERECVTPRAQIGCQSRFSGAFAGYRQAWGEHALPRGRRGYSEYGTQDQHGVYCVKL